MFIVINTILMAVKTLLMLQLVVWIANISLYYLYHCFYHYKTFLRIVQLVNITQTVKIKIQEHLLTCENRGNKQQYLIIEKMYINLSATPFASCLRLQARNKTQQPTE